MLTLCHLLILGAACESQYEDARGEDAPAPCSSCAGIDHDGEVSQHVRHRCLLQKLILVERLRQILQISAPLRRAGQDLVLFILSRLYIALRTRVCLYPWFLDEKCAVAHSHYPVWLYRCSSTGRTTCQNTMPSVTI